MNTYNYFLNKKYSEKEKVKLLKKTNVNENYILFKSNFKKIKKILKFKNNHLEVLLQWQCNLFILKPEDGLKVLLNGFGADDYL